VGIKVTVAPGNRLLITATHRASMKWGSSSDTVDEDAENILVGWVTRTAEKITAITLPHDISVILSHNKFEVSSIISMDTGERHKAYNQTSNIFFRSEKDLAFFLLMCDPATL